MDKKEVKQNTAADNTGKAIKKKFSGVVVSDKMLKTLVVRVDRVKVHPKYKKRYTVSKKYKVHDEKGSFKEGDKVSFIECRPLSKDKKWRAINK
jgi:small subunit ribosomal protein S17